MNMAQSNNVQRQQSHVHSIYYKNCIIMHTHKAMCLIKDQPTVWTSLSRGATEAITTSRKLLHLAVMQEKSTLCADNGRYLRNPDYRL